MPVDPVLSNNNKTGRQWSKPTTITRWYRGASHFFGAAT